MSDQIPEVPPTPEEMARILQGWIKANFDLANALADEKSANRDLEATIQELRAQLKACQDERSHGDQGLKN